MLKFFFLLLLFSNEKVPSNKEINILEYSVRQRYRCLSIILSNFHAFINRKFMMKFLVGFVTQQAYGFFWHPTWVEWPLALAYLHSWSVIQFSKALCVCTKMHLNWGTNLNQDAFWLRNQLQFSCVVFFNWVDRMYASCMLSLDQSAWWKKLKWSISMTTQQNSSCSHCAVTGQWRCGDYLLTY